MQCRLRPQSVGAKLLTLFLKLLVTFFHVVPIISSHKQRHYIYIPLHIYHSHFLFPQTVSHSNTQSLSMVQHEQEAFYATTRTDSS
jgi:hypothetical protein